jgi:hypothetical protein
MNDATHEYTPKVDENEHAKVEHAVERENEDEEVVRNALEIPIDGVECVRCPRSRN